MTPRRVQITASQGKYFKPGQYGYVVGENLKGGSYVQDREGASAPGEMAYLVSKTKEMRGGALWFSASGVRFTGRTKSKRTASLRRAPKRRKAKRGLRRTARTRLRKRISRRRR